jgi:membrane-bound lytic murein transglycosylase MltF
MRQTSAITAASSAILILSLLAITPNSLAQTSQPATDDVGPAVLDRTVDRFTGDLTEMRKLGRVRLLVSFSRTNFFVSAGRPRGFDCDLMTEYQTALQKQLGLKDRQMTVVFIPVTFDDLIPALLDGRGDIAAGGMTVTTERQRRVAFADPYLTEVDEVVVAAPGVRDLRGLDDLAGREVRVVKGSSYADHLARFSRDLQARGKPAIRIVEAADAIEAEDLLEMVNVGIVELTVVDRYVADAWSEVLRGLTVRKDLAINTGGKIALAVRPDNPQLLESVSAFSRDHRKGTLTGNILLRRYFEQTKWLLNPLSREQRDKFDRLRQIFQKYAPENGYDWLFLTAQGFQESGLDQSVRSEVGAVGIMQVRPATGREMGFPSIDDADNNIHAGAKYMAFLRDRYFLDATLAPVARLDFTLAAYNAGPENVRRWREKARARGLDPNRWRGNVERISLEMIGEQTYRYVRNIDKYYVAYKQSADLLNQRAADMKGVDRTK